MMSLKLLQNSSTTATSMSGVGQRFFRHERQHSGSMIELAMSVVSNGVSSAAQAQSGIVFGKHEIELSTCALSALSGKKKGEEEEKLVSVHLTK